MMNTIAAIVSLAGGVGVAPPSEGLGFDSPIGEHITSEGNHIILVGDSISNKNTNTSTQSSMYWGVLRTWHPEVWAGIMSPTNSQSAIPAVYPNGDFVTITNHTLQPSAGVDTFSHDYERFTNNPGPDFLWHTNAADGSNIIGTKLADNGEWAVGPWFEGAELEATFFILSTPESPAAVRVESRRGTDAFAVNAEPVNQDGAIQGLVTLPVDDGDEQPWFRLTTHTGDESLVPNHILWLGTLIKRTDVGGFTLDCMAVGGSKVAHHLSNGLFMSDTHMSEYFALVSPTIFYIQLGANDGNIDAAWQSEYEELIERYDALCPGDPYFVLVAPYGTVNSFTQTNALIAADYLYDFAINGTTNVSASRIAFVNLPGILAGPISSSLLVDNIHPAPAGADFVTTLAWREIVSNTACKADLTGGYADGIPNGVCDADDMFFFLDAFTAGDLAIADLTGSSDPNSDTYGSRDWSVDSDDFFYYLDVFTSCNP